MTYLSAVETTGSYVYDAAAGASSIRPRPFSRGNGKVRKYYNLLISQRLIQPRGQMIETIATQHSQTSGPIQTSVKATLARQYF